MSLLALVVISLAGLLGAGFTAICLWFVLHLLERQSARSSEPGA